MRCPWRLRTRPVLASLLRVPRPDIRTAEGRVVHYTLNNARASPLLRPLHTDPRWQTWTRETFGADKPIDLAPLLAATGPSRQARVR